MSWLSDLFFSAGVAHSILILAIVISFGVLLGKVKIFGVSLGITCILFVGILLGELGVEMDPEVLLFFKEFGLILFVFSIGLQVGPSFFSNFKKDGLQLNLLAISAIALSVLITLAIYYLTDVPLQTMVGIMSGAITNTPGLGAAQQAYTDITGAHDTSIAMGYAVAYPLGVVGGILSMIIIRAITKPKLSDHNTTEAAEESAKLLSLVVQNPSLHGRTVSELAKMLWGHSFVISRIWKKEDEKIYIASSNTVLELGDKVFVVTDLSEIDSLVTMIGQKIAMREQEWKQTNTELISQKIVVTRGNINGKRMKDLKLRDTYGVNVTRVTRAGIDIVASPNLVLQFGDKLTVVGPTKVMPHITQLLGNSLKHLHEPNLVTIFIGIALGVLLGSLPITFPGIPHPIKLGLAGGPLIVAILIARFGHRYKLISYTTQSANLMLREIGITAFLACVGLGAGNGFIETIVEGGGSAWIGYGVVITVVPLLTIGLIGRLVLKLDYFTLCGVMSGATTDPPALAYANSQSDIDQASVSYATVYPLTMFLRVLVAQLLIIFFL